MSEDENPSLIFEAEDGDDALSISHIPLVLTHDGGGTCFSYYCLDPLSRPTYEIHNPRFFTQQPWAGGIPEMAKHYVSLIRTAVPQGRILLGGWSLGGILSLEMARLLADDPCYNVLGIVMVDSICPGCIKPEDWQRGVAYDGQFSDTTNQETRERVKWCFGEAVKSISEYSLPSWDDDRGRNGDGPSNGDITGTRPAPVKCPPTILLRASETVPVGSKDETSHVDLVRHDRSLGWNAYRDGFFQEIVDVPGHHFNMFAFKNIDKITASLIEACRKLEGQAPA